MHSDQATYFINLPGVCCLVVVVAAAITAVILVLRRISGQPRESYRPAPRREVDRPAPWAAPEPAPAWPGERCPECGAGLPADSPQGLCPRCLLRGALCNQLAERTSPHPGGFTAPTPEELAPHFPQLEILELLGQGGMGAVYKARQTKLDRLVALKILPPEPGRDPAFAERFTREARALARLNHPHVVGVHDFGEAGGLYYFVMEYVDGLNLRQLLTAGRLGPGQALAVVEQVCDALQYAHEEGVIHRDIKPENILVDRRGRAKIADFGLARILGGSGADLRLTGSRQLMGTPHYMAPEQMERPHAVDHRADIFSLGVVFYELLTGELPLGRFAPPSEKARVDRRLDDVVLRALAKEPERRYQRAGDMRSALHAAAGRRTPAYAAQAFGTSRRFDPEAREPQQDVRKELEEPAKGLHATSIFNLVTLPALSVPAEAALETVPTWLGLCLITWWVFAVGANIGIMVGTARIRRLRAYGSAVTAGILALGPWGIMWPISLPVGVWTLVILSRPRVRQAFEAQATGHDRVVPAPPVPARRDEGRRQPFRSLVNAAWYWCVDSLVASRVSDAGAQSATAVPNGLSVPQAHLAIQEPPPVPAPAPPPAVCPARWRMEVRALLTSTTGWACIACLVGVSTVFFRWCILAPVNLGTPRFLHGYSTWHAVIAAGLFLALGVQLWRTRKQPLALAWWRPAALIGTAASVAIVVWVYGAWVWGSHIVYVPLTPHAGRHGPTGALPAYGHFEGGGAVAVACAAVLAALGIIQAVQRSALWKWQLPSGGH